MSVWLDTLHKEWSSVGNEPWSFAIAIVAVGSALWAFTEFIYRKQLANKDSTIQAVKTQLESQVAGLKEQIAALEQQLKLAVRQAEFADRAKLDVEKELQTLKATVEAVEAKQGSASLSKVEAQIQNVESAIVKLSAANNAVNQVLSPKSNSSRVIEHMIRNRN